MRIIEILRGHRWKICSRSTIREPLGNARCGWCSYLVCKDCGIQLHISILGEDKSIYLCGEDRGGVYCGFGRGSPKKYISINIPKEYSCKYRKMEKALR